MQTKVFLFTFFFVHLQKFSKILGSDFWIFPLLSNIDSFIYIFCLFRSNSWKWRQIPGISGILEIGTYLRTTIHENRGRRSFTFSILSPSDFFQAYHMLSNGRREDVETDKAFFKICKAIFRFKNIFYFVNRVLCYILRQYETKK